MDLYNRVGNKEEIFTKGDIEKAMQITMTDLPIKEFLDYNYLEPAKDLDWHELAKNGRIAAAVAWYHENYGVGIREAHAAVRAYLDDLKKNNE